MKRGKGGGAHRRMWSVAVIQPKSSGVRGDPVSQSEREVGG
jgi:hypothetical protein